VLAEGAGWAMPPFAVLAIVFIGYIFINIFSIYIFTD
jgi:hypothetical protein